MFFPKFEKWFKITVLSRIFFYFLSFFLFSLGFRKCTQHFGAKTPSLSTLVPEFFYVTHFQIFFWFIEINFTRNRKSSLLIIMKPCSRINMTHRCLQLPWNVDVILYMMYDLITSLSLLLCCPPRTLGLQSSCYLDVAHAKRSHCNPAFSRSPSMAVYPFLDYPPLVRLAVVCTAQT